jgi:3D (Asp-Asp-Asp) domain-containing protein
MTPAGALFVITAYSLGCDAPGPHTKAGTRPVAGFTVAADPAVLPIGSIIHIEGLGERMVHDVGGKVRGLHIDVYMGSCHEARVFGKQKLAVQVLHLPRAWTKQVNPVVVRGTR